MGAPSFIRNSFIRHSFIRPLSSPKVSHNPTNLFNDQRNAFLNGTTIAVNHNRGAAFSIGTGGIGSRKGIGSKGSYGQR